MTLIDRLMDSHAAQAVRMAEKELIAYGIYLAEYYNDHDKSMTPVCLAEFLDNEMQDDNCRKYYFDKIRRWTK